MRPAIYGALLISLAGLAYETSVFLKPDWLSTPSSGSLTDFDPVTRVGTFRFPGGLGPIYIQISDATGPTTENDRLVIEEGAEKSSHPIHPGGTIPVGNEVFRVDTVRPWVGILPDPRGRPLISISIALEDGIWAENMILGSNGVISIDNYQLRLELLNGKTVEEFIEAKKNRDSRGRWGIEEGDRIHWFDNLLPGSGVELDDGTIYTLLRFREQYQSPEGPVPAIVVRVEADGIKENRIITTRTQDGPVKLEFASGRQVWFVVAADNAIEAVALHPDSQVERESLRVGESWKLDQGPMTIRVEQYNSAGVAVNLDQTPFQEVVLVSDNRRVRVRQGEAIRVGDALLRYQRVLAPDAAEYEIAFNASMTAALPLKYGGEVILDIEGTRYRIRYADVDMDRTLAMYVLKDSHPARLAGFIVLGILALLMHAYRSKTLSSDGSNSL